MATDQKGLTSTSTRTVIIEAVRTRRARKSLGALFMILSTSLNRVWLAQRIPRRSKWSQDLDDPEILRSRTDPIGDG
jgi:hypothetical protein